MNTCPDRPATPPETNPTAERKVQFCATIQIKDRPEWVANSKVEERLETLYEIVDKALTELRLLGFETDISEGNFFDAE